MTKKRIGFINEEECPAKYDSFKGYFVNRDNPNFPKDSSSPNYPRVGRVLGYQNPILGDPGRGEIARWQKVRTNALHSLVDQMIEQYTRDRRWYSTTRCREALWNMYRRLEWWVVQNVGYGDSDYKQALSFIRDCIVQILDPGERPKVLYQHRFKDGEDNSFEYKGDWEIDEYGNLSGLYVPGENVEWGENNELEKWIISKTVKYPSKGLITFNYAISGFAGLFRLKMDDEIIWEHDSTDLVLSSAFNFRDITLTVPKGTHKFTWEFVGELEGTSVKIDKIAFIELMPKIDKSEDIPKCPLPYTHHFASDYMNYFTGVPYVRPTFSTVGGSKVSDYLDMIRYVSSKENIEWKQVKGEQKNENIFKLPLERLPETLSSKITFNWRLKRKGYITFKYWVDGGNGSELSFYINNQLVGGPWRDTDGWQEASFNVSLPQTYKFDFLVHKSVSKDLGTNAVYIKDIEVVEVTDYTDEPMPGDYSLYGEEAEAESGKWLIYSHKGVLGTYYRGFPDGADDSIRELELEFYSECDGVFGFGYKLGTEDPDRYDIEGLVFSEPHDLSGNLVVWDGEENGVGVPTIKVNPIYAKWSNAIPDDFSFIDEDILWSKDNDANIKYHINIDGDWDKGKKLLFGEGRLGVMSPPKYIAEEKYKVSNLQGYWDSSDPWYNEGEIIKMKSYPEGEYGRAVYVLGDKDTSFVSVDIEDKLLQGERLNIYVGGKLYFSSLSGFGDLTLDIPIFGQGRIEFEVEKAPEPEEKLVFAGSFGFDGDTHNLKSDKAYEIAKAPLGVYRLYKDGRGREFEIKVPTGGLESPSSWFTSDGFKVNLVMLPKDKINIRIPNTIIPYVDKKLLKKLADELTAGREYKKPVVHFYESFNPYENWIKIHYCCGWEIIDVFRFLDIKTSGDKVLLCKGDGKDHYVDIDLKDIKKSDGTLVLNMEYGALFKEGNGLEVLAYVDGEYKRIQYFTTSSLRPEGFNVKNIGLPDNIERLRFIYHS